MPAKTKSAIDFIAGDEALNRNDDFLYTLFVPARAHLAFPCFDQPDLKARYKLALEIPPDWRAVANGAETEALSPSGKSAQRVVHFAETQPLPTYLFAFAAGKFQVETAVRDGRSFRMFHRETDCEESGAQPRGDLRSARARSSVAGRLHRDQISVGQVRFRADSVFPIRRHGARRRDLLQRVQSDAGRIGDAEPDARPRQHHRSRDRAHVVRRPGDHALVQRRVDEGSDGQLHGGQDREPVVSERESSARIPVRALPGRLRR